MILSHVLCRSLSCHLDCVSFLTHPRLSARAASLSQRHPRVLGYKIKWEKNSPASVLTPFLWCHWSCVVLRFVSQLPRCLLLGRRAKGFVWIWLCRPDPPLERSSMHHPGEHSGWKVDRALECPQLMENQSILISTFKAVSLFPTSPPGAYTPQRAPFSCAHVRPLFRRICPPRHTQVFQFHIVHIFPSSGLTKRLLQTAASLFGHPLGSNRTENKQAKARAQAKDSTSD